VEGSKGKFSKRDSVHCSNVVLGNTVGQVYTPALTTGLSCEQLVAVGSHTDFVYVCTLILVMFVLTLVLFVFVRL
jgi:hypothetical protein